jgi:hypothetical protein
MGYLVGLEEYLEESYNKSIFEQVLDFREPCEFHLHGHRTIRGRALARGRGLRFTSHRPRCFKIFLITFDSSMNAMIRIASENFGHHKQLIEIIKVNGGRRSCDNSGQGDTVQGHLVQ